MLTTAPWPLLDVQLPKQAGSFAHWLQTHRAAVAIAGILAFAGTAGRQGQRHWATRRFNDAGMGLHDVHPAVGAHANGYLVFTAADGDIAYLKYQFRGLPVPGPDGKPRFLANGFWETAGGTGKLKACGSPVR
jgi:hypothetical protein